MLNSRQQEILELLKDRPFLKTGEIQAKLGLTRARVNQLIGPLIRRGLIRMEGAARATTYSLTGKRDAMSVIRENYELRKRVRELEQEAYDRKVIERAKEILIAQFDIRPTEAYRKMQEQSMSRGRPMREIAEAILSSYEF